MPGRKHTFFAFFAEKAILPLGTEDPTRYFASDLLFMCANCQESGERYSHNHDFSDRCGEADPGFLQDFPGNLKIAAHRLIGNDCFLTRPAVMRYLVDTPIRQDLLWKKQNGRKKQAGTLAS